MTRTAIAIAMATSALIALSSMPRPALGTELDRLFVGHFDVFAHPGVFVDRAQLGNTQRRLAAGAQPWTGALAWMRANGRARSSNQLFSSPTYAPAPVASIRCGPYNNPDIGCTVYLDDAVAAYTQALLYAYTGDAVHGARAIAIMNAWSSTLTEIRFDTTTHTNGMLVAGWGAQVFTRAAEIMRYGNAGWASADITRFGTMLRTINLPHVNHGWTGGGANWLATFADATMAIGVFLDDRAVFEHGVATWRALVPSVIYMTADGPQPVRPPGTPITNMPAYWRTSVFVEGLEGETCRDMSHATMGLDALVSGAETARIQGVDLYGEQQARLVAGYEFNARWFGEFLANGSVPTWLCNGSLTTGGVNYKLAWEVGYSALAHRRGVAMPYTWAFIQSSTRPSNYKADLFMDWQTLTHAEQ